METRMNYFKHLPEAFDKLVAISTLLKSSTLDPHLIHLIKIRASQINGCTFCIDMHVKEAKIDQEKEIRLHHVAAWHESPLFSLKERAALMWTETLTKISEDGVPDDVYAKVSEHFTEKELVELTMHITVINSWNRFAVSFRAIPGSMDKLFGLDKAGL